MVHQSSIAFVGDYSPRRCGIATFTSDICEAIAAQPQVNSNIFAVAVNDVPDGYPYSPRVRFEIREKVLADYYLAADFLNINQVSVVCLQHEFGLYGGASGSHILSMLRRLRRPLVTTLHTVLREPSAEQLLVMRQLTVLSDRLVVLSETGRQILRDVYGVAEEKLAVIPHGIPDTPFVDPNYFKDKFGIEGRKVLLTFGLLSSGKGIEYVISAMPRIVREHGDAVYIILGATHPKVKRESSEDYRNGLIRTVHELGMQDHVIFQNRFVDRDELMEYIGCADVYITPYLNEAQVVSGTLAYAMGAGKAVVSTPYWHAVEMLADNRGRLAPFRDSDAIANEVNFLLSNEVERHAIRKRAYNYCRRMVWPQVAQDYLKLFSAVCEAWSGRPRSKLAGQAAGGGLENEYELPEVDLRHLCALTDDTGLLKHCIYATPDRTMGYGTADNARALIVSGLHWVQTRDDNVLELIQTYLSFLWHAYDEESGVFRPLMNYDRCWSDDPPDEEAHSIALWGLGYGIAKCPHESMIALATRLFIPALAAVETFTSPLSWAYSILGLHAYLRRFSGDSEVRRYRALFSEKLMKEFESGATNDWPWPGDVVPAGGAKLPHALLMSGKWMSRGDMIDMGRRSLEWLMRLQARPGGGLSLIGSEGRLTRDQGKAQFDQLPIDAAALLEACIEAWHVTGDRAWVGHAREAFNWFLGQNDLRMPLHDSTTGGCRDGLHSSRVNENQGAQSLLSWLLSLLRMHDLQMELNLGAQVASTRGAQDAIKATSQSSSEKAA